MEDRRYPTHDEVLGLLARLEEICHEAERVCRQVAAGLPPQEGSAPGRQRADERHGRGGRHLDAAAARRG
jgi:hypothetical protein